MLSMNFNPTKLCTFISLDNIEALAWGEGSGGSGSKTVECNTGQPTNNSIYPVVRWCGDCKTKRIITSGDGHCTTII